MTYNPFEELSHKLDEIKNLLVISSTSNTNTPQDRVNEIIDRETLCKRLGITEPTVIRHQKRGKIPFLQIGSSIRYDWNAVVQALVSNKLTTK
ncbi:MAG: hypothetical protein WKF97_22430 [Chitinophagaceae bacterium]